MKRRERQINCLEKCNPHCINPDNKKCVRHVFVWHGGISDSFITDRKEGNVFIMFSIHDAQHKKKNNITVIITVILAKTVAD